MTNGLILASASVTRARLLEGAGLDVRIEPAGIDERAIKQTYRAEGGEAPCCALALAEAKARQVAQRDNRFLVIGADQILVCGEVWFDKPSGPDEARAQLQALRGCTHELVTAACAVQGEMLLWHAVSRPQLTMREFTDQFLDRYIAAEGAEILGSVGAYRLEGRGVQLFERIEGDYFAILGLPLLELLRFLRDRSEIAS
jgi:nucleoside triphosphate pyrophosphatase